MKRFILFLLVIVAAVAAIGWAAMQSPGYVLITYDHFRYESTLWVFLALLAALWVVWFLLRRILKLLALSGAFVNPLSRGYRNRRAAKTSLIGQRELAEGQWSAALGHLRVAAEYDERPLVHYLGAARAAEQIGDSLQSERLLDRALSREPDAALAIGLTRAGLQLQREDYATARASLEDLYTQFPKNAQVLFLMQQLYVRQRDWAALCGLFPELRRHKVLPADQLTDLERLGWAAELQRLAESGAGDSAQTLATLKQRWQSVPSALQADPALVRAYAAGLFALQADQEALERIEAALRHGYAPALVELYGRIPGKDPAAQLLTAEGWLKAYAEDGELFLALARLSQRCEMWDKACGYFESSLAGLRRAEVCTEYACLLAQLGQSERSNQLFQEGLQLSGRMLPAVQD